MRGGSLKMFLRCGWFCIRCHFPWVCSWGWATQGGIEFQRVVFSCVHFCFSILVLSFCLRSLSLHPLQKKILSGASFSRISINLRDECDYNIFFTGKKTSVALETFLEEVKLELASIEFDKPKDNISTGERQALKELSRNKSIILKKSDKGKHHRIDEQTGQTKRRSGSAWWFK